MQEQHPHYFVYILGAQPEADVQIGIADDLRQYVSQLKQHDSLTKSSMASEPKLVYYEHYSEEQIALNRERQIKSGDKDSTNSLVSSMNPNWLDLSDTL